MDDMTEGPSAENRRTAPPENQQRTPAPGADQSAPDERRTAPVPEAWSPFDLLRREIDRLFDDFRSPFSLRRVPATRDFAMPRLDVWRMAPAVDLVEKDAAWELTAELPGLDERSIEVSLAGGSLSIRGEKQETSEKKDRSYHLSERRFGSFQRSFRLPEGVDAERIEARFENGVLTVTLPKAAEAQRTARRIEVRRA